MQDDTETRPAPPPPEIRPAPGPNERRGASDWVIAGSSVVTTGLLAWQTFGPKGGDPVAPKDAAPKDAAPKDEA